MLNSFQSLVTLACSDGKFSEQYDKYALKQWEWQLIAEFESVMKSMNLLSLQTQKDEPGEIAFSWLNIQVCRKGLELNKDYQVVKFIGTWESRRPREELPQHILTIEHLAEETRTFIKRLIQEFSQYFPRPDGDQVIAMMVHPFMHWNGFK